MKTALCVFALLFPALAADPGQWPKWRGPNEDGVAVSDAPVQWSDTENVKWKVEIPGLGHSSPVIWGDKLFLTTAVPTGPKPEAPAAAPEAGPGGPGRRRGGFAGGDTGPQAEHKFMVLCLDKNTGKVIWERVAKTAAPHEGYHRRYGSFASNTPVTDGKHLIAFFGSRGVFAYDLDGNRIWEKDFGVPLKMRLGFGEGVAPALHGDTLVLTFDHQGDSFMVALDKNTGRELWRKDRDEESSWAQPLVVEHGGRKQVIVSATTRVRSYDLKTGEVIWECGGLGANVIPAPVVQNDVVFVMSGYRNPNMMAIKLGGKGDLTGTDAILWTNTRGNSYTPSPVLQDNKLYFVSDNGMVSCLNATTGEPYYLQQRLPKTYNFKSSPVAAKGKLYLATEDGDVVVLKMGEKYEVLATNTLRDQSFIATPAIADGAIYLRGQNTLFCIRDK